MVPSWWTRNSGPCCSPSEGVHSDRLAHTDKGKFGEVEGDVDDNAPRWSLETEPNQLRCLQS
jgi:hypothetical protein